MKTKLDFNKFLFICFSVLFVFSSITVLAGLIDDFNNAKIMATTWTNHVSSSSPNYADNKDSDGYIKIQTADQLAYISKNYTSFTLSTIKIRLYADIKLSSYYWVPIQNFGGTFDGNGHIIDGLKTLSSNTESGLFYNLKSSSIISNIFFTNASVVSKSRAGTIASYSAGGTITNCHVMSSTVRLSSFSGYGYVGGLIGYNSSYKLTITNCSVASTSKVYASTSETSTINYSAVGGLVGYLSNSTSSILKSFNSASVYDTSSNSSTVRVGGLVAYTDGAVDQSYNTGDISGGNSSYTITSYVGGIAGYSTKTITNCYNKGNITANAKSTSSSQNISQYTRDNIVMSNSNGWSGVIGNDEKTWYITTTTTSNNQGTRTITVKDAYAGGIVGHSTSSISSCYNHQSATISGGWVKYSDKYSVIFSYSQKIWQFNILWWSSKDKSSVRTYFITVNYLQTNYYSGISGNRATTSSCYSASYPQNFSTSETVNVYEKNYEDKNFGTGGLLDLLNLIPNASTSDSTVGYVSSSFSPTGTNGNHTVSLSSNVYSKDLQEFWSRNQSIGFKVSYSSTAFRIYSTVKHNGTEKSYVLQADNNAVAIQQSVPSGYNIKNSSSVTPSNLGSTSIWGQNSLINGGHPYLKGSIWA